MAPAIDYRLYAITPEEPDDRRLLEMVEAALSGGVTVLQLRQKRRTTLELVRVGEEMVRLAHRYGVPLIVNDRVDVMLAIGADGVHLGVDDMPLPYARRLVGRDHLLGFSPGTPADGPAAEAVGADYLGVGSVFPTTTKGDAGPAIGLETLEKAARSVRAPVVAVGGIQAAHVQAVMEAGAAGIAVVSEIFRAPDPAAAARRLRALIDETRR